MDKKIIAIIPARGGSKGIPRKNIKLLGGKPLIAYSIEAAVKSRYIDRVIVSTEDEEIAEISKKYGAEVIERPLELAQDDTPSLPVFQHVIKYLEEAEKIHPKIIVILQPTSPLRLVEDVDATVEKFLQSNCNSVVSLCEVEHPPHWMYTLSEEDRVMPIIEGAEKVTRRQDAPKVYRLNGAVYVAYRDIIMEENKVLGNDTRAYIMPPGRSIDIDTEIDLKLAELMMGERGR
jgi:CMP-N-acetylneuraminic acid synthetase